MLELEQYIFELKRSINRYGKEDIGADELLEVLQIIQKILTNEVK